MTIFDKLCDLRVPDQTIVTLKCEDNWPIVPSVSNFRQGALCKSSLPMKVAKLITQKPLSVLTATHEPILEYFRVQGLLKNYIRGSKDYENYVAQILCTNGVNIIDSHAEIWDRRRGSINFSATLKITIGDFRKMKRDKSSVDLSGWMVEVKTKDGSLMIG